MRTIIGLALSTGIGLSILIFISFFALAIVWIMQHPDNYTLQLVGVSLFVAAILWFSFIIGDIVKKELKDR